MREDKNDLAILTLKEAARFIRVSEKTLGEMARKGCMPAQKVGREWRFLREALEKWLSSPIPAREGPTQGNADVKAARVREPIIQYELPFSGLRDTAFRENYDRALHRWVPWIAGFSASFVDGVLEKAARRARGRLAVLDPFAGVGTTLVEALKNGHDAIGFEINPYAALASKTKVAASQYDVGLLQRKIALFRKHMSGAQRPQSGPPGGFASRVPFFSPSVERQVLRCIDFVNRQEMEWVRDLFRVAVGSVLVSFSNYSYEPSLGTRVAAGKGNVENADVGDIVVKKLEDMLKDIAYFQRVISEFSPKPRAQVLCGSFFDLAGKVAPQSIDVLITSPPYLNNYHYIRNTRPQMFWLGMISAPADLKEMEQKSFGQFWQTVRTGPPVNLEANMPGLSQLVEELRNRNLERGPYGGPGWANYAASYFNDCARFCRLALALMKPSGTAVIVIGNNILQGIEFPTDKFFAQIAEAAGFEIVELHEVRRKRTGSSIVNSSVRAGIVKQRTLLYETAIELRAAGATKVISSRLQ